MSALAQIIGGSFTDVSGNALAGGQAVFQLSNDEATNPAANEIGAGINVSATLDSSGNVITSPATYLYITDLLNPSGAYYTIRVYTAEGQLAFGPQYFQLSNAQVSSGQFSLDNIVPMSIYNPLQGGGGSVNVNGSAVPSPNFNGTTPSPVTGGSNVVWQVSSSSISAYIPAPTTGTPGVVPALPSSSGTLNFLRGDGSFAQVTDADLSVSNITTNNVSTSAHGFAPKAPNDATKYLDGTGAYSVPVGSGSVDVNGSSVSSPNFNGTIPATVTGGCNVIWQVNSGSVSAYIPAPTTGTPGVVPALNSNANTFLNGTGSYSSPGVGALPPGIPFLMVMSSTSNASNWSNYSIFYRLPSAVFANFVPSSWRFSILCTAGTGAHIYGATLFSSAIAGGAGTALTSEASITFGGSATPSAFVFGRTASTSNPYVIVSDAIAVTPDASHDWWICVYFDADGTYNSTLGLGTSSGGPFNTTGIGGYHASSNDLAATVLPTLAGSDVWNGLLALTT